MPVPKTNIWTMISDIQANPPALVKDARGQYGSYLSLGNLVDAIVPMLAERNVTLFQSPTVSPDGQPAMFTRLMHTPTETYVEAMMLLMSDGLNPQKQGSAITYARRYALVCMLGLVPDDDDDGQSATDAQVKRRTVEVPTQAPVPAAPGTAGILG